MTTALSTDRPTRFSPAPLTHLSEDEQKFREEMREFAEEKVRPRVSEMDREERFSLTLIEQLFSHKAMGIEIPTSYGGAGGSLFTALLAIEEIARVDPSVAVLIDVHNALVVPALLKWGSPVQKARYLTPLATSTVGAFAISEDHAGSDVFAMSTAARPDGDGWILDGRKQWTTNGAEAGLFIVFAKLESAPPKRGITAFLIDRDTPGLEVGERIGKMGLRASSTCELTLVEVRLGGDSVLGEVGRGNQLAMELLNVGRLGIGAQMLGLACGAWDAASIFAQSRQQFGQPISQFQGVHFPLAEMATEIEAARLMVYNAARLQQAGAAPMSLIRPAAMVKYFTSQVAERIASQAVEIFGGRGVSSEYPVEKFYRDAKIGRIYEGTSNIQLRTIALTLLETLQRKQGV